VHRQNVDSHLGRLLAGHSGITVGQHRLAIRARRRPDTAKQPHVGGERPAYPGAPNYFGPLYALTFRADVIVSVSQIYEP